MRIFPSDPGLHRDVFVFVWFGLVFFIMDSVQFWEGFFLQLLRKIDWTHKVNKVYSCILGKLFFFFFWFELNCVDMSLFKFSILPMSVLINFVFQGFFPILTEFPNLLA